MSETPFDSIEGAYENVHLLLKALDEAHQTIRDNIAEVDHTTHADRQLQALRLVDYKLTQLRVHVTATSRLLNDLRTLRRLLLGERDDT